MKFRPCIDLHAGKVKQIIGSTLTDSSNDVDEVTTRKASSGLATNFCSDRPASDYATMYARDGLTGGHVIMLGPGNVEAAREALRAYPNGLQIGGGMNPDNAHEWLDVHGASHVVVTSYAFRDGAIDVERLERLVKAVGGRERLVLDLSCRKKNNNDGDDDYYVVTDRWQTYTDIKVNADTLKFLAGYCDEFLVHGVENEGKRCGILEDLVTLLGEHSPLPVTYAGGVSCMADLDRVNELGRGKVDLTIGSALDCFGGDIKYDDVVEWHKKQQQA